MSEQFSFNLEVTSRADLIRELKAAGEHGLTREYLHRCGISSLTACATELRRVGYEIEVTGGGHENGLQGGAHRRRPRTCEGPALDARTPEAAGCV